MIIVLLEFIFFFSGNIPIVLSNDINKQFIHYHASKNSSFLKRSIDNTHIHERFVRIDFDNVDIKIVIKFISEITGTNFILDQRVKNKKITLISPKKISEYEVFHLFESILEVHGLAMIKSGSITKIIPAVEASQKNIETRLFNELSPPEDKIITQLIQLKYANPDDIKKLFLPLISKTSKILTYPQTNSILVTDVLSNIQRLLHILSAIDVEKPKHELFFVKINHTSAEKIVKTLSAVLEKNNNKNKDKREYVKVIADEHTNSVIVLSMKHKLPKIRKIITLLDKQVEKNDGKIRVRYLEYADAEELVNVLNGLSQKDKQNNNGKKPLLSKNVIVVAEKATNSLIITAEKSDYAVLDEVINKIDIPRPMVYIECLIMDVSVTKETKLGVNWNIGNLVNSKNIADNQNAHFLSFGSEPDYSQLNNFNFGIIGKEINVGNRMFASVSALYNAVKTNKDFNIIATPQIMTMDNIEAEIMIGDKIPYLTKKSNEYGNTYEYNEVGIKLKVKPQINKSRYIRLELTQIVESINNLGENMDMPSTSNRSTKTTIVVKDNETAVISGLIKKQNNQERDMIPCLGNIPILKMFFRSKRDNENKTNMFVFLTPHILSTPDEADSFHNLKRKNIGRL